MYCVIQSADSLKFGAAGIGDNGTEIHTVHYRDLAAVVSDVPLGVLDSTRENVLAHERVNEIVMRDHTVIPMSFGTIFKTRDDIVQLLRSAYDAFGDVLSKMRDKMEFGLKVLWDRDSIVKDIEDEDEGIHRLKNEIALQKGSTYFARMQYGRAIDAALQSRSERYGSEILDRLRDVAVASRINKPIGDKMIMNAAFLVSRDQEAAFDTRVKSIAAEHDKLTFKYTGPVAAVQLREHPVEAGTRLMFLLDSLLINGISFVLDKVATIADAEINDPERQRERLLEAQMKLETGEITDEEFADDREGRLRAYPRNQGAHAAAGRHRRRRASRGGS